MTEMLDSLNGCQGDLLDVSMSSLSVKEVATNIIDNVLRTIIFVLNQNHANSVVGSNEIKSIVTMVVRWKQ